MISLGWEPGSSIVWTGQDTRNSPCIVAETVRKQWYIKLNLINLCKLERTMQSFKLLIFLNNSNKNVACIAGCFVARTQKKFSEQSSKFWPFWFWWHLNFGAGNLICKNVSLNQKSWLPNGDRVKTLTWRVGEYQAQKCKLPFSRQLYWSLSLLVCLTNKTTSCAG